nr:ferrous iron transporter B [Desulfurispira natronophila]
MGNPNVGKSVIFAKLTGMKVESANYAGTTITYTTGEIAGGELRTLATDVPGTYSLQATSPAEEVATQLLGQGAHTVLCVLDATNLERNLPLALQVASLGIPVVYALNMVDVARRKGIEIDVATLEKLLGAPVVPTSAVRGDGLKDLREQILQCASSHDLHPVTIPQDMEDFWDRSREIAEKVETRAERPPTFWDRFEEMTICPLPGIPIAIVVLIIAMGLVVGGGKALRALVLLPVFDNYVAPAITAAVSSIVSEGILRNVLVGEYGMLIKGIEWPIALILPYVAFFYVVMSFLEDSGYLPRLGVLLDNVMRAMGIQGSSVVPMFMGYGCAIPAILGTKAATSQKERLMVTGLVALAIPCTAQTGAFIVLLGDHSMLALVGVYAISFSAMVVAGALMSRVLPGKVEPMLMEIPNLLMPDGKSLLKKIWLRIKQFFMEAEIPMVLGIGAAALVAETGALVHISAALQPLVEGLLGLPPEASLALLLGIIRRELAVLPLLTMDLTLLQLMVGSIVALFYLPCIAVFFVIIKEFRLKFAALVFVGTMVFAFAFGGALNYVGQFLIRLFSQ